MAHLPYLNQQGLAAPEVAPLVERIVAERGSLLHLYQMLLHSPPLAQGWLAHLTQVRQKLALSGALRELVIVQIAHLNGAPYEAAQHVPIALREGLSHQQLQALPDWRTAAAAFDAEQQAALALADTMTRAVQVDAAQIEAVRSLLGERQTVELVGVIATYNMVSRFLQALHIQDSDARDPLPPSVA
jgi:AhpD family alkylhydroperoxidase